MQAARYYATHFGTTVAAAATAIQWPLGLLGLTGLMIDNPWSLVMDRAEKCGRLLADVLAQVCLFFFLVICESGCCGFYETLLLILWS